MQKKGVSRVSEQLPHKYLTRQGRVFEMHTWS